MNSSPFLFSDRLRSLQKSGIRAVFDTAERLEKEGRKIIHFEIGRPHFRAPDFIVEATLESLRKGNTVYVANRGPLATRRALVEWVEKKTGARYDAETEVCFTVGASEAVAVAILSILNPGDEILVPTPAWPHYVNLARFAGAVPVELPLVASNGYQIDVNELKSKITARTKLVVLNNPCNPTGAYQGPDTQKALIALAHQHGLQLLVDEIYDCFTDEDVPFTSMLSHDGARDVSIYVNGCAKAYGMTGYRIGYFLAPAATSAELLKAHQYLTVCGTSFGFAGAEAAFSSPAAVGFLKEVRADYAKRRRLSIDLLSAGGLTLHGSPQGAFYIFLEYPRKHGTSIEVAQTLLQEYGVATVPGEVFGAGFDRHLRISYTPDLNDLKEGLEKICRALAG